MKSRVSISIAIALLLAGCATRRGAAPTPSPQASDEQLAATIVEGPRLMGVAGAVGYYRVIQRMWPISLDDLSNLSETPTSSPATRPLDELNIAAVACLPRSDHEAVVILQTRNRPMTVAFDIEVRELDDHVIEVVVRPSRYVLLPLAGLASGSEAVLRGTPSTHPSHGKINEVSASMRLIFQNIRLR